MCGSRELSVTFWHSYTTQFDILQVLAEDVLEGRFDICRFDYAMKMRDHFPVGIVHHCLGYGVAIYIPIETVVRIKQYDQVREFFNRAQKALGVARALLAIDRQDTEVVWITPGYFVQCL